jgi:fumarate reductase subunit D
MILFILALAFPILLTLVFIIPGEFLFFRWLSIFATLNDFREGDLEVPTFYSTEYGADEIAEAVICIPIVGVVFGGIHCVGWFFNFPSSGEAMLWRVSSAVLTIIAFLIPLFVLFFGVLLKNLRFFNHDQKRLFTFAVSTIILLVYVVSRLILIVESFISLRRLSPGMLALVKWTSFIPHI